MKKWLKSIILASVGVLLLISGILSWNIYFSNFKIFYDQEDLFLETVKRYYTMNQNHLPKRGETRIVTLQDMYNGNHIVDLYIPKTNELCDINSWVRVYKNDNDDYNYTTYLKCGKFESSVDHLGPEINLNGDKKIIIALGSKYEELGVKSVVDNIDGNIENSNVIIDTSKLDVNKVGNYEVTYTVMDSSYNKTVVTREVTVAKNLTEVVKSSTDETNYYKGNIKNNYLLFSGMLFRIVNVNSDGSVKIISESSITNLRMDYSSYDNSNVDSWLNNIFYPIISDNKYIVDTTYCVGNISSMNNINDACSKTVTKKVGLLSIVDYNKSLSNNETYLNNDNYFALSHKINENYAAVPYDNSNVNGLQTGILASIRPVITLKNNLFIVSGNGSSENPYKLNDYEYGKKTDNINTRIVGEYIEYSGLTFRIIGFDKNKNVKLIMSKPWNIQPNNDFLKLSIENMKSNVFNLEDINSPGYVLNNDYIDYINSNYIVETEYDIPTNVINKKYNEYQTEKVKAKILLPKSYELFSSIGSDSSNKIVSYLFIDKSTNNNLIYMVIGNNGLAYEMNKENFTNFSIKAVITIKGNLKISSGKGTINKPYILK